MKSGDESSSRAPETKALREQAADWIAKRDAGFTAQEQDAFFEWLAEDPKHAEIYAELQSVYKEMDVMVEWRPLHALEPNPDLLSSARPRPRSWRPFALLSGLAAMVVLGVFFWRSMDEPARPTLLAVGDAARSYERHVLDDGSIVEMNRGAQVSLQFEPHRRSLNLISGEAHFKVARDPKRPFVVRVGGIAVTAIGTQFNIALASDQLEVFVTEGRIRVDSASAPPDALDAGMLESVRTLDAGQGVVMDVDASSSPWVVEDYSPEIVERKLAWKNELVDFTGVPLSEVVIEFNRRNHTQLLIGDDELGELRMNGMLRPANLEAFVELLTVTQAIRAERHGTSKIVLWKREQP